MSHMQRSTVLPIALLGAAFIIGACSNDSATAPAPGAVLASKGSSDDGGSGSSGGGSGGGGGGGHDDDDDGGDVLPPTVLTGPVYLRESFGFYPLGNSQPVRFEDDGDTVQIGLGTSIDGIRAEWPNTGSEVWMTPDVRHEPSWGFGLTSLIDPDESSSTFERSDANGVVASNNDFPIDPSNNDALLAFLQPPGAVTASLTVLTNTGGYTTAVGFATAADTLAGDFERAGAAWLVLRIPRVGFQFGSADATWEVHTDGVNGPTVSGTIPLAVYPSGAVVVPTHRIAISYDPDAGTVVGSVDGVATPALHYSVHGVKYVGFQGNGIVNDFRVDAGAISPQ